MYAAPAAPAAPAASADGAACTPRSRYKGDAFASEGDASDGDAMGSTSSSLKAGSVSSSLNASAAPLAEADTAIAAGGIDG